MTFAHEENCNVIHSADRLCGYCEHVWAASAYHNICGRCGSVTPRTSAPMVSDVKVWVTAPFPGDHVAIGGIDYMVTGMTLADDTLRIDLKRAA